MGEYEEAKAAMQTRRAAKGKGMSRQMVTTEPIWGTLDKETWWGKVTLMERHDKGQRYIPNDEVKAAEKRGWKVVVLEDPTKPRAKEPQPKEEPTEPTYTKRGR